MYNRRRGSRTYTNAKKKRSFAKNNTVIGGTSADLTTQTSQLVYANTNTNQTKVLLTRPRVTINVQSSTAILVYWAFVYVPEGYTANTLSTVSSSNLYEPNQFVMASGSFVSVADSQPVRMTSPIKRNINEGDSIFFIMRSASAGTIVWAGTLEYYVSNQ